MGRRWRVRGVARSVDLDGTSEMAASSVTGTRFSLAAFITARPTSLLPVKTRWSKGKEENAEPSLLTIVTCSGEKTSLSIDASTAFVAGVNFDGLSMTRLPAA